MSIQINGTSGISGVDGTAGTPALQGTDSNTGISFGTDTVNINTGGSTRATVDSSGRVLVGTSSGSDANSGADNLIIGTSSTSTAGITINTGAGSYIGRINFGRGATNKDYGYLVCDHSNGFMSFGVASTERMRIKSNGEVIFDGTSASGGWASPGTIHIAQRSGSSAFTTEGYGDGIGFAFAVKQSGSASGGNGWAFICYNSSNSSIGGIRTSTTATSFPTSSDYRLKENIVPITDALERVQALKPSRFNFIVEPGKIVDGFLAHEVQDVVPEAIHGIKDEVDNDGNPIYQGIDQSKLVPLLTAALQEAIAKIESLETRLTALEGGAAQ